MIPGVVLEEAQKGGTRYLYNNSGDKVQSIKPCESLFGYTVWSHMIPPFRPNHTLILGYGGGTAAELIRKIWGLSCKITGVDIKSYEDAYMENKFELIDAKKYVWDSSSAIFLKKRFDYICIDLWNGLDVCDFIFETEFVVRLREMATKLVCMNILVNDMPKTKGYYDYGFKFDRVVPIEKNIVLWWSLNADYKYKR